MLLDIQPVSTFKQIEEESLSICDLYDLFLVWCCFVLHLLLVVFVQETEGITHANGVAEIQALVVLSKVLCANPHFLILLCRGYNGLRHVLTPLQARYSMFVLKKGSWTDSYYPLRMSIKCSHVAHLFAPFERPTARNSESQGRRWESAEHGHEWHS